MRSHVPGILRGSSPDVSTGRGEESLYSKVPCPGGAGVRGFLYSEVPCPEGGGPGD